MAGHFTEVTFGFDTCETPSIAATSTWKATSPFTSVGIYFGRGLRACSNNSLKNPTWVNTVVAQGWRLIPIHVGAQAPCSAYSVRIEPADASCSLAVKQFIGGWVTRLRERGYRAGYYSSLNSGIADQVKAVNDGYPVLDAIWIAAWNDTPHIFGFPQAILADTSWAAHQRNLLGGTSADPSVPRRARRDLGRCDAQHRLERRGRPPGALRGRRGIRAEPREWFKRPG